MLQTENTEIKQIIFIDINKLHFKLFSRGIGQNMFKQI
jgi:hypothetical protein